jgi:hypothetical protein
MLNFGTLARTAVREQRVIESHSQDKTTSQVCHIKQLFSSFNQAVNHVRANVHKSFAKHDSSRLSDLPSAGLDGSRLNKGHQPRGPTPMSHFRPIDRDIDFLLPP